MLLHINSCNMTEQHKTHASKLLSLVLRHKPEIIHLVLDASGWADVTDLLAKLDAFGAPLLKTELEEIVATNSKQRFTFNEDGTKIRASQGHSVEVDLQLAAQAPLNIYTTVPYLNLSVR